MGHKKSKIQLNGEDVEVDTSIVPLIKMLNEYGIKTLNCCEGDKRGYIAIDLHNVDVYMCRTNGELQQSVSLRFNKPQEEIK